MDRVVSDFFVCTSSMNVKPNVNKFTCWLFDDTDYTANVAGSVSELFVEPLLSCINDLDSMYIDKQNVVVQSVLSNEYILPSSFHTEVTVFKIVNTQSPSYVKLLEVGELHKLSNKKHVFVESTVDTDVYFTMDFQPCLQLNILYNQRLVELNGPAASLSWSRRLIDGREIKQEIVSPYHCLQWPLQAADWLVRPRKYNWPTPTTVDYIVSIGCDVVPIIRRHHHTTQLKTDLCRLSFSRAETVLLNTWTTTQQIVYHMLRTVLSYERLDEVRDKHDRRILSRYHIKTLMLWACELKHSIWWIRFNVVVLCSKFLQLLGKHCVAGYSRGYFVTKYNLFECDVTSVELHTIAERTLTLTNVSNLTKWFITNYICKYVQLCSYEIQQQLLSYNVNTANRLHCLTCAIVGYIRRSACYESFERYSNAEMWIIVNFAYEQRSATFILGRLRELETVDGNLLSCFVAGVCLRLSTTADRSGYDDVINVMKKMPDFSKGSSIGSCKVTEANSTHLYDALSLMQQNAVTHSSYKRHSLLSRCCLLLTCSLNTSSSSHKRLSRIYLAMLYYHLGQYKMAAEQCASLANAKGYKRSFNVIEGLLLPLSDRDICNVLGLVTLYHHVADKSLCSLNRRQRIIDPLHNVFSVEVFAQFLDVKCSLKDRKRAQHSQRKQLKLYNVCDYFLHYITSHTQYKTTTLSHNQSPASQIKRNICGLESQLLSIAVENLTTYRRFLSREFSSVRTVVTTDVEAMHAYKLGFYEHCLQLSQRVVISLWSRNNFLGMILSGSMATLLADNLASLTGLMEVTGYFSERCVYIDQLTLSLVLLVLCKLKLNYTMESTINDVLDVESLYRRHGVDAVCNRTFLAFAYRLVWLRMKSKCVR